MAQPAYIVLAHKRPDLLFRLLEALGDAPIALHVNRKSDIWPEVVERTRAMPNVTLLRRKVIRWGGFGIVTAAVEGLKWFVGTDCDYAVLLTGQCYPIRTQAQIVANLDALEGRSLMDTEPFPKPEWSEHDEGGYRRTGAFYFKLPWKFYPTKFKSRLFTRRPPRGLHPWGGCSYWCLSRAAVDYVLKYMADHPDVTRYFRSTLIPDEMFFHTLIGNSPLREQTVAGQMHYADWSAGGAHPAILGVGHLPKALASESWFARKFEDHAVLDEVDMAISWQADAEADAASDDGSGYGAASELPMRRVQNSRA